MPTTDIPYRSMHYSIACQFSKQECLRSYKQVRRRGRTYWRNYKREIAGGISLPDLVQRHLVETRKLMNAEMNRLFA